MNVEFVGIGNVRGYTHEATTDLKKLAKQITKETGVATDIRGDNLIVGKSSMPVDSAVVIANGGVRTLSLDAFKSQYREVVDLDVVALSKTVAKLEKTVADLEKTLTAEVPEAKPEDVQEAKAEKAAATKAEDKPKAEDK